MQPLSINYNPDVLSCLANLSNDEVFTSPEMANQMLDRLPQELFSSPNTTFLDPATKSGVFLREIAKRLLKGLELQIPDLQQRIDHILTKQLFGLGITELTTLLARRSLYCARAANSQYAITSQFNDEQGNIRYQPLSHSWEEGKCTKCGASKEVYDRPDHLENHAYSFIHQDINKIFGNNPVKFDVIIGNPPYQLAVGNSGGNSSKAKSIYHLFMEQAIKLDPQYVCMIIPSRWMTRSTEGISDEWIDFMISSNHFREIHDFEYSSECFPGVSIEGGVNYFLWDNSYTGKCSYYFYSGNEVLYREDYLDPNGAGIIIRNPRVFEIINKIMKVEGDYFNYEDGNFSSLVSPKDYFTTKQTLTSKWDKFSKEKTITHNIKYYLNKNIYEKGFGWVSIEQIPKNIDTKDIHKVYIPAANGSKTSVLGKPFYGENNSICSQTYLVIGYAKKYTKEECYNIVSYIKTKFFRYLVSIKKQTQNGPRGVYQFVPLQDFNEGWSDEKLYEKYNLSKEDINYIDKLISSMD